MVENITLLFIYGYIYVTVKLKSERTAVNQKAYRSMRVTRTTVEMFRRGLTED